MMSWRFTVLAVGGAAGLAGCFTYFVAPPLPVEADQQVQLTPPDMTGLPTWTRTNTDQRPSAEEQAAAAYQRAAAAILRQLPNAQASVGNQIKGHIPLPKQRPIPR